MNLEEQAQPNQYISLRQLESLVFHNPSSYKGVLNQCGDFHHLQVGRMDLVVEDEWRWPKKPCPQYEGHEGL